MTTGNKHDSGPPKEERGECSVKRHPAYSLPHAFFVMIGERWLAGAMTEHSANESADAINAELKAERDYIGEIRTTTYADLERQLKAEREKREQAERDHQDFRNYWRELARTNGCEGVTDAIVQLKKCRLDLLAAQAAIEKHNRDYKPHSYAIKADLSALREHDAEVRKEDRAYWLRIAKAHDCEGLTDAFVQLTKAREVRKPLVEALQKLKDMAYSQRQIKLHGGFPLEALRIIDAALASV